MYRITLVLTAALLISACVSSRNQDAIRNGSNATDSSFTIAVIPDTQNYLDFNNQKSAGFGFDANDLFIQQMKYLAQSKVKGLGDIAFVASVGDVWQHQTKVSDEEHSARGILYTPNPIIESMVKVTPETLTIEVPKALEGYQILEKAGIPFGVAPGNHDYDAIWTTTKYPPNLDKPKADLKMTAEDIGILHVGGLDNFKSVFGSDSDLYKNKDWYIASYDGGSSSAQRFSAGDYTFLHLALEMHPGDRVIAWAESVIAANPGLPTIISTHDYLNIDGERKGHPIEDLSKVDPEMHNNAQYVWEKLFSQHTQIFLVLSGHQYGQSYRVDPNEGGHLVYQVLANYQDRKQVSRELQSSYSDSSRSTKLGDGWVRLMHFDLKSVVPTITVKTYSTYYKKFANEVESYAKWYKSSEHPELSDTEFLKKDDFVIKLTDFYSRFNVNKLK